MTGNEKTAAPFSLESFDVRLYLGILKKHRWLILSTLVAGLFAGLMYNETQTPIYVASTRIEFKSNTNAFAGGMGIWSDWYTKEHELNTHFETLRSFEIMKRIAKRINLQDLLSRHRTPESRLLNLYQDVQEMLPSFSGSTPAQPPPAAQTPDDDWLAANLYGSVSVEPVKDTNLADVMISHHNPFVAAETANVMAEVYDAYLLESRFAEVRNIMSIYTDQLLSVKKALRESEDGYLQFINRTGISSLQEQKSITIEGLSDLKLNFTDTRVRRAELESELNNLESVARADIDRALQTTFIDKNPMLNQIKTEITTNQVQLQELQKKYRPQHPEVVKKESLLQTLKQKFLDEIQATLRNKRAELDVLQAKERELGKAIRENESIAIQDSSIAVQYKKLKDEMDSNKTLYETLLNKIKELDITKASPQDSIKRIEKAMVPGQPVSPRKSRNLGISILLGLLIGIGLAFGLEQLDNTFKNTDQIRQILQLPTLAMVGRLPGKELENAIPLPHNKDTSTFHEAFRFLKTNLSIATLNRRHALVLVTSTGPSEGKTTVAINLAISMAREGKEVLLLDMDLRRPRLHRVFKASNERGFTNLIVDPFESIPLSGSLSEVSLNDILYLLIHQEKSGVLTVNSEKGDFRVFLSNGKIAQIDSPFREEDDKLGSLLVTKRNFPKYSLHKAVQEATRRNQKLGEFLFSTGAITIEGLVEVLQHQFISTFNQLIQVTAGTYHFDESDSLFFHPEIISRLRVENHILDNLDYRPSPIRDCYSRLSMQQTPVEHLYLLTSGPRTPDPNEIFSSDRVIVMLNLLKKHFHTIVIDSPPAALVADSGIISPVMDAIIYVVKYGGFSRKLVHNTLDRVRRNSGKIIGTVLNLVDVKRESYDDYHYYYSDYYSKSVD